MRWLITGGAGFIGSHLVDRLLADGHSVVVYDDFSTGRPENLAKHPRLKIVNDCILRIRDVAYQGGLEVEFQRPEHIVHLAAVVGVKRVMENPRLTMEINTEGTRNALHVARAWRVPIFIASSSEVYGLTDEFPCREDQPLAIGDPTKTRWSYAASKLADECLAFAFAQEFGIEVRVGRFFNTVGPRQSSAYGMVIPTFVKQALAGERIVVHGSSLQRRTFCHVSDTVTAILRLCLAPETGGQIYNIGSQHEISMGALADLVDYYVNGARGYDWLRVPHPYGARFEDMPRRLPDISKIKAAVGWEPAIGLAQIIADVIAEQRK